MKAHTKVYMQAFDYGEQDFIPCEICGSRAVDIHHIERRGMGATDQKNDIVNLMGLCRLCHIRYGDKKNFIEWLKEIHQQVMQKFKLI